MKKRLQKILSEAGVASRRAAEEMIAAGRVRVNGRTAHIGDSADDKADHITVNGEKIGARPAFTYLMLNKPRGAVTTMSDERNRKTAAELVSDCGVRVFPVGRLDAASEGLLLFTNDGELTQLLTHPSHGVSKIYHVLAEGDAVNALPILRKPIEIDGSATNPAVVDIIKANGEKTLFRVTIHEGKNRQIRRLCEAAGLRVARLKRVKYGELILGELPLGTWRHLTAGEVARLRDSAESPAEKKRGETTAHKNSRFRGKR